MDTPGFEPNAEGKTFREIIRGIELIRPFACITGFLYLTSIPQERFDDFNGKLIQFIGALSGAEYIRRVMFITTFSTATPGQAASYKQCLVSLRKRWEDGVGVRVLKTYQHGCEYDDAGRDTGLIVDWFINREQIARHAKEMIARNYGSPTLIALKIEEELDWMLMCPFTKRTPADCLGCLPHHNLPQARAQQEDQIRMTILIGAPLTRIHRWPHIHPGVQSKNKQRPSRI